MEKMIEEEDERKRVNIKMIKVEREKSKKR